MAHLILTLERTFTFELSQMIPENPDIECLTVVPGVTSKVHLATQNALQVEAVDVYAVLRLKAFLQVLGC